MSLSVDPLHSLVAPPVPLSPETALQALIEGRYPTPRGRYGPFGGRFVPEVLVPALTRLETAATEAMADPSFQAELHQELRDFVGRPTALTSARRLGEAWGCRLFLKREDLAHTGAHKINNALGQALLAKRLGAKRVVAETGAGQHGVATAAACARVGLACTVYMGAVDVERQAPNVDRMRRLGAEVHAVTSGQATLRAAIDEALRAWVHDPDEIYYLLGSAVGPHPYPRLVQQLQAVIGTEARRQMIELAGGLPDYAMACVGGGSNAIGLFHPLLADREVKLVGLEAGGASGLHSATITHGEAGVLHGAHTLLLQDEAGQIDQTHSISAGLDYAGVGPEHALLASIGRVSYEPVEDHEALTAFSECCRLEGIIPALESSHALAGARRTAAAHPGATILVCLSGRGDKDLPSLRSKGL